MQNNEFNICDHFRKMGPNACFFKISKFLYSRSLKYPLHIASYTLRIRVSVMELKGTEFLINHTFQCKHYISIVRTENFIMHALGPFLQKRSHIT